ncbi:hypothetical protein BDQ17DRAFT_1330301 [Cyathus striatus]|nr:hypothetical protein BDQ17DRAFT_1330301 [Cyathus striatus]
MSIYNFIILSRSSTLKAAFRYATCRGLRQSEPREARCYKDYDSVIGHEESVEASLEFDYQLHLNPQRTKPGHAPSAFATSNDDGSRRRSKYGSLRAVQNFKLRTRELTSFSMLYSSVQLEAETEWMDQKERKTGSLGSHALVLYDGLGF